MANRRILVIANRSCPCPTLADEVAARAGDPPGEVLVVAPALNTRLRHWVSDVDGAIAAARDRLDRAVANLSARGIAARGVVGDSDPLRAIEDALAGFPATEIVLSMHPPGQSNCSRRTAGPGSGPLRPTRRARRLPLRAGGDRDGMTGRSDSVESLAAGGMVQARVNHKQVEGLDHGRRDGARVPAGRHGPVTATPRAVTAMARRSSGPSPPWWRQLVRM